VGNSATRVAECNKTSCEKSYLLEFSGCLHYSFTLENYTFLEIKEVNVSKKSGGKLDCRFHPTHQLLESSTIVDYGMKAIGQLLDKIFYLLLSELLKKIPKELI
jgi:hypothetical protein